MADDPDLLTADFAERHPDAFSRILARGDAVEVSQVVRDLPPELRASIVARLPAGRILALLDSGEHSPVAWLTDAPFDDAVDLLSRMRRERRLALIDRVTDEHRKRELLRHEQYPTHTIGWYVQDVQLRVNAATRASDLVSELRELDSSTSPLIVVVDTDGRYTGILDPWQILGSATASGRVRDYMTTVEPLHPEMPVEAAVTGDGLRSHNWLPVVDNRHRVIGGVLRATLLRAASTLLPAGHSTSNVMSGLISELVYVLGSLLDGMLARRKAE